MGKYGKAAVKAAILMKSKEYDHPADAWETAAIEIFGKGTSSQRKVCPKSTFLALCERGLIKGVLSGDYTNAEENKEYAIKAIQILKNNPKQSFNANTLWGKVFGNMKKSPNGQMDVVLTLWNEKLISS